MPTGEARMQLGMIGLGRMGANMVRRLLRAGHECVVYNRDPAPISVLEGEGAAAGRSLQEFVSKMRAPRCVWLMIPAGAVDATLQKLLPLLSKGDTVIDGGNSYYIDDIRRSKMLAPSGIEYVDVGTSGGVFGLERGYCLMIGGETDVVQRLEPIFVSLAPGFDPATRTPGREGPPAPAEQGWLHCGPNGAGHFVKMVHNGIEY